MSDNKQKRLQSLNQDVLAVSRSSAQQTADATRQPSGNGTAEQGRSTPSSGRNTGTTLLLAALTIAVLAILAVGSMTLLNMQQTIDSLQAQLGELKPAVDVVSLEAKSGFLEGQMMLLDERLSRVEQQPAPESSNRNEGTNQAALSQVNARVRKLDIEGSRLQTTVDGLTDKLVALQSRTQRVESLTAGQRDTLAQLSPQVQQLNSSLSQLDKQGQLEEIETRLERLNNDVRSIYRMLEMGR